MLSLKLSQDYSTVIGMVQQLNISLLQQIQNQGSAFDRLDSNTQGLNESVHTNYFTLSQTVELI